LRKSLNRIVIATTNSGKLKEIKKIFSNLSLEILSLSDFPGFPEIIEDGNSFEENAEKKAKTVFKVTGIPALGDDSGLEVELLKGAPGIYSARYSGEGATYESNNKKLLKELEKLPMPYLSKFVCVAVFYDGTNNVVKRGELSGQIIKTPKGTNGFGYDPIFVPDGFNKTLAELSLEEKNKISHRAKAFCEMRELLETI
jgi:XTP/dITP diphosphohydrolase